MEIKGATSVKVDNAETALVSEQRTGNRQQEEGSEAVQPEKTYSKEEIAKELQHLNKWLESKSSHLKFVLHDELNKYYVQVIDDNTNEVIKEIPSKKIMDIIANFYEKLGLIVDKKV
ncbi:flagellar protein FlaG [Brevibacillus sp. SYP-B805]|uniref:flagellar protein FlaG n=1 Tax=Brevibacillus sp. SYP-B805 TaxID=1578199 RepID=UPI0013E9F42F|nr:flagellar protein FlaG [Brevibacillus sp. SYP-B805]NGQ95644.1 flagellar protein FlaG [Brevibacillus sp. SYP-B805]